MSGVVVTAILPALIIASWHDIAVRRLPDSLNVAIALISFSSAFGLPADSWIWCVGRSLLLFGSLLPLCGSGLLGGGDVKLMAALSLGLSFDKFWEFLLFTAIAGGFLGFTYLIGRGRASAKTATVPQNVFGRVKRIELRRIRDGGPLPYGVAISIGWCLAVLPSRLG